MPKVPVREVTEALLDCERRFPVEEAKLGGLAIWPLLRLRLLHAIANGKGVPHQSVRVPSRRDRWIDTIRSMHRRCEPEAQVGESLPVRPGGCVFWCQVSKLEPTADGAAFHKFFHSLLRIAGETDDSHRFWYWTDAPFPGSGPPPDAWTVDRWLHAVAKPEPPPRHRTPLDALTAAILDDANARHPEARIDPDGFLRLAWKVLAWARGFESAFRRQRPSAVFLTCFYAEPMMALSLACNRLRIPCVELQHGQQGDWHSMYTHWSRIPSNGYDLIPNIFWMWDERGQERIERWLRGPRRRAVTGGNPWLAHHLDVTAPCPRRALPDPAHAPRRALVSLQYSELPDWVWDTIAAFPEVHWSFRLHPRFRSDQPAFLAECRRRLGDRDGWELEKASAADFYEIIREVDLHVTGWSTTAYEALAFGVPTILIHPNALDAMGPEIRDGVFRYAADRAQFTAAIRAPGTLPPAASGFQTSAPKMRQAFVAVTASRPHAS